MFSENPKFLKINVLPRYKINFLQDGTNFSSRNYASTCQSKSMAFLVSGLFYSASLLTYPIYLLPSL
jgi:hypothetical protein